MFSVFVALSPLFLLLTRTAAVERAELPPLAWSSWYSLNRGLHCDFPGNQLSESVVLETADGLLSHGFQTLGFTTLIMDDCWANATRSADGSLVADVQKFPSGMGSLVQQLHRKGLKAGLYTTPGNFTCTKRPASGGHMKEDFSLWINDWNIDYLKLCVCNTTHELRQHAYADAQRILQDRAIIHKQDLVYEIDPAMEMPMTTMPSIGDVVGFHGDVDDTYESWAKAVEDYLTWNVSTTVHASHWPLIDILQTGYGGMSDTEYAAQISMWVMLKSPLILGIDMRNNTWVSRAKPMLSNQRVLDILLDGQKRPAVPSDKTLTRWTLSMADGSDVVALWNRGETATQMSADMSCRGKVTELWSGKQFQCANITLEVRSHEVKLFRSLSNSIYV